MSKLPEDTIEQILELHSLGLSSRNIAEKVFGKTTNKSTVNNIINRYRENLTSYLPKESQDGPKVLVIDIETAPSIVGVFSIWNQNVGINQIETDWFMLAYCAKWLGEDSVYYEDMRGAVQTQDDSELLQSVWILLDQADIIVGHNIRKFDVRKLNSRFIMSGMSKPSPYKIVDTLEMVKRTFGFTSNKLQYLTDRLCTKYKKSEHGKFHGYHLWEQCMLDNPEAWKEMENYNEIDVLSNEELYQIVRGWDNKHPNVALFYQDYDTRCNVCGGTDFKYIDKDITTNLSKFGLVQCSGCGAYLRNRLNTLSKDKKKSLLMNVGG